MSGEQDDWEDSPLVRALRAPGTPAELAGEERIVAAFRATSRRRLGVVRRLGTGGTAAVAIIALSGGVAAAYTNRLPDPVQRIAHTTLAKVGVPAPQPMPLVAAPPDADDRSDTKTDPKPGTRSAAKPDPKPNPAPRPRTAGGDISASPTDTDPRSPAHTPPAGLSPVLPQESTAEAPVEPLSALPSTSPAESSSASGSSSPSTTSSPTPSSTATTTPTTSGTPSGSPTGSPTSSPTGSPTSSPTGSPTGSTAPDRPRRAGAVTIGLDSRRLDEGTSALVTGVVTDTAGDPMSRRSVALLGKSAARPGWRVLARGRTDAAGAVMLVSPGLLENTRLRLRTKGARSSTTGAVVVPTIAAAYADGRLTVTTSGSRAGETVVLSTRPARQTVEAVLDETGRASFPLDTGPRRASYVVSLPSSPRHAAAHVTVVVPP